MNDLAAAAILGLVQGLTEFLPVSSTAHLVLISDALGLDPARFGLSFDVALHLGTALAVLLYFARTWLELASDVVHLRLRMPFLIVVGTLPAALAGVAFQSQVETALRCGRCASIRWGRRARFPTEAGPPARATGSRSTRRGACSRW